MPKTRSVAANRLLGRNFLKYEGAFVLIIHNRHIEGRQMVFHFSSKNLACISFFSYLCPQIVINNNEVEPNTSFKRMKTKNLFMSILLAMLLLPMGAKAAQETTTVIVDDAAYECVYNVVRDHLDIVGDGNAG